MAVRVADLTVDDLRELLHDLIRELVEEVVEEKLGLLADLDDGLEFRPEVAESLREYLESKRDGDDAEGVFRSLGLE